MSGIRIDAPAKLNLHLLVGDRRPDGFHEIESLFLALAFGDTLYLEAVQEPSDRPPLEIRMDWQLKGLQNSEFGDNLLPPDKNIIFRAVSLFKSSTGYDRKLKIAVEKRIPLGGGLGGGSSDAAATLLALNRLASSNGDSLLSDAALAEIGAELGSDVPFFLNHRITAAWVSGRGEQVWPFPLPQAVSGLSFVLVNPGFSSDTAHAYSLLDKYRQDISFVRNTEDMQMLSFSGSPGDWQFSNDFLSVFNACGRESYTPGESWAAYGEIISSLRTLGAGFAGLSGSGSTCFGVFSGPDTARQAGESLSKRWPYVIETFPLAHRVIQRYNY